ncbi:hypothetical protein [Natronolimnobius sp. AArcel1]|uniref:hypothetical protein n=1 Tax=Natronolimnobius sp. AArcel1 TaxID=1679093 RepID=UPI001F14FBC3|nr:hypothetical protein [Natronolimnobius sp. AArcel1]
MTRRRALARTGAAISAMALAGCGGPGEEGEENGIDPEEGDETAGEEEPDAEEGTGNGQDMEDDEDTDETDDEDE